MFQKIKKPIIGLVAIVLAIYLSAGEWTNHPEAARREAVAADRPALKRVKTALVEASHTHRELRFSGTTRAVQRARLAFSLGGRVMARPVEIGDRVASGQLLAGLDDLEVENAAASARAAVTELAARRAQSERDRDRAEQLAAAKAATVEELEKTAAAVDAIRAAEQAAIAGCGRSNACWTRPSCEQPSPAPSLRCTTSPASTPFPAGRWCPWPATATSSLRSRCRSR